MGNKCDKENERQVSSDQAKQWCKENGDLPYFETSALEDTNVSDAFMTLIQKALAKQESNDMEMLPDSIGIGGGI